MALLKSFISKNTFLTITGIWNAVSSFVTIYYHLPSEVIVLIVTVGNLIIGWLGVESGNIEAHEEVKEES